MPLPPGTLESFFARSGDPDPTLPGERVPHTSSGNRVEYLIDGAAYFAAISKEIDDLSAVSAGRFFYVANWWFGLSDGPRAVGSAGPTLSAWHHDGPPETFKPVVLDRGCTDAPSPDSMLERLTVLVGRGVDLRALVWIAPVLLSTPLSLFFPESPIPGAIFWVGRAHSLLSARGLRSRIGDDRVVLNTLAHPLGAWHVKLVVCGDATDVRAYLSGMDFVCDRYAQSDHAEIPRSWHDAGVCVRGPAALAMYEYFRSVWNEQIGRPITRVLLNSVEVPTHSSSTPALGPAPVSEAQVQGVGTQHVQVSRTVPITNARPLPPSLEAMNIIERILLLTAGQTPVSFAPDGIFEFRLVLRKAIASATSYVYIEDEAFMGLEIMGWLNARLLAVPELKVILVWGADPGDPPDIFLRASMERLIDGVANPAERVVFCEYHEVTVHSKIFIIDDTWASVGSANCARRSLYTDGELTVSVLDEESPSFAERLRRELWSEHCGVTSGSIEGAALADLGHALAIWRSAWGAAPLAAGLGLKSAFERKFIPFEYIDPPGPGQWATKFSEGFDSPLYPFAYDFADADSR